MHYIYKRTYTINRILNISVKVSLRYIECKGDGSDWNNVDQESLGVGHRLRYYPRRISWYTGCVRLGIAGIFKAQRNQHFEVLLY